MTDLDRIQEIVTRVAGIESIPPDADIYESGITSMGSMDVMLDLEAAFTIVLADEKFVKARTCQQLLHLVQLARAAQ
jgi:acyl carrier protein